MMMPSLPRTLSVVVVVVACAAACTSPNMAPPATTATAAPAVVKPDPTTVIYEVEGVSYGDATPTASLTFASLTGSSQFNADLPLTTVDGEIGLSETVPAGTFLYVSVQAGEGTQSVTCRIRVNAETVSENTSRGEYAIATCKATA